LSTRWSSTCARSNTSAVWVAASRNQSGSLASRERMRQVRKCIVMFITSTYAAQFATNLAAS
jgi:hypothetical protein